MNRGVLGGVREILELVQSVILTESQVRDVANLPSLRRYVADSAGKIRIILRLFELS